MMARLRSSVPQGERNQSVDGMYLGWFKITLNNALMKNGFTEKHQRKAIKQAKKGLKLNLPIANTKVHCVTKVSVDGISITNSKTNEPLHQTSIHGTLAMLLLPSMKAVAVLSMMRTNANEVVVACDMIKVSIPVLGVLSQNISCYCLPCGFISN